MRARPRTVNAAPIEAGSARRYAKRVRVMQQSDSSAIAEKLGVGPGVRVWVCGHEYAAKSALRPYLEGAVRPAAGPVARAFVAARDIEEALYFIDKIRPRLDADGMAWVACGQGVGEDDIAAMLTTRGLRKAARLELPGSHVWLGFRTGG